MANVSKRTLYKYFASKDALFRCLAEELASRITTSLTPYEPGISIARQLARFVHDGAMRLISDPNAVALLRAVIAEHVRNPKLVASATENYWRGEYGFADWVTAACADGKLTAASPERASRHFQSLIKGVVVWPAIFERGPLPPEEIEASINEAIGMFVGYYGT